MFINQGVVMPITSIFSATHCHGEIIAQLLSEKLGYNYLSDELIESAATKSKISRDKLQIALYGSSSHFSMSEIERRLLISFFKKELLTQLQADDIVYLGYGTHLLAPEITHVLKVCLLGSFIYRVKNLRKGNDISEKDAKNILRHDDRILYNWTQYLFNLNPPDKSLYDIVLPMNKFEINEAIDLIYSHSTRDILTPTPESIQTFKDELLAVDIQIMLLEKKHDVDVKVKDGKAHIYIKKFVLFMEKYKHELIALAEKIQGVQSVKVGISKQYKPPSIATPLDLDIPQKILLVDDEVEFVQTLSERLKSRNINSSIAYNGEEALEKFEKDPPEVMILDLKMPGINGLEVLKRVKQTHHNTEVVILTGHGSSQEKQAAFELGCFAYLEKPVDINVLSETMRKAYEQVNKRKKSSNEKE